MIGLIVVLVIVFVVVLWYGRRTKRKSSMVMQPHPFTVIIINLDRRPDRLNAIMAELLQKGFPSEIIHRESAVDGKKISKAAMRALYVTNMNIFRNHLNGLYPTEWLLVLEDDARLVDGIDYARVVEEFNNFVGKSNNKKYDILRSNIGSCPKCWWGTEAVFYSKSGCKKMLDHVNTEKMYDNYRKPFDHALCHSMHVKHTCIGPEKGMFKQADRGDIWLPKVTDTDIG